MTIGIGVLASDTTKPDALVMIADTMGSFGDTHSTSELHKLHAVESEDIYSVSAGQIDQASEQINMLLNVLRIDYPKPRKYSDIVHALLKTAVVYRDLRFGIDSLPQFRMTPDDWFRVQDPHLRDLIFAEYQNFYVGCEMLVGTFGDNGQTYLFHLPGNGTVVNCSFPGFAAIGVGANNAMFWLSYRKHKLSCSIRRSAYHAYEAKRMADIAPHVNDRIDLVVAKKGKHHMLHQTKQTETDCPVSLLELPKLFKRYNVRDSTKLDPEDQSTKPIFQG